jgi:hypothetical protein
VLVESWARAAGAGTRLVDCLGFARGAGYAKVRLWTNAELQAARRLYERAGFHMVEESPGHRFGHDQVFQTWELGLT